MVCGKMFKKTHTRQPTRGGAKRDAALAIGRYSGCGMMRLWGGQLRRCVCVKMGSTGIHSLLAIAMGACASVPAAASAPTGRPPPEQRLELRHAVPNSAEKVATNSKETLEHLRLRHKIIAKSPIVLPLRTPSLQPALQGIGAAIKVSFGQKKLITAANAPKGTLFQHARRCPSAMCAAAAPACACPAQKAAATACVRSVWPRHP